MDVCMDVDLWWLWCGNEANAQIIGPFPSEFSAEENAKTESGCGHDHVVFRGTAAQIAKKMPSHVYAQQQGRAIVGGDDLRTYVYGAGADMAWFRLNRDNEWRDILQAPHPPEVVRRLLEAVGEP
jgi:hypothetical protein